MNNSSSSVSTGTSSIIPTTNNNQKPITSPPTIANNLQQFYQNHQQLKQSLANAIPERVVFCPPEVVPCTLFIIKYVAVARGLCVG